MVPMLGQLREMLDAQGRDASAFGTEAIVDFSQDRVEWGREIEAWQKAGGTHLALRAMDTAAQFVGAKTVGFRGPRDYIDALETFQKETNFTAQ